MTYLDCVIKVSNHSIINITDKFMQIFSLKIGIHAYFCTGPVCHTRSARRFCFSYVIETRQYLRKNNSFSFSILEGQTIRKGTSVYIFIYGINYDANVFPNPEKFDPERFADQNLITDERSPFAYIPFSAGSRNCIGKSISFMIINDF
jgi:hypothetical protein